MVEKDFEISESKNKKEEIDDLAVAEKISLSNKLMKNAKALGIIQGAVSKDIFPRISNEESSEGAWDILSCPKHRVDGKM